MSYLQAADDYPTASPDVLGLDPARLDDLIARAQRDIDDGLLPSCQLSIARNNKVGLLITLGDAEPDSRYVLFSCTKALTASAFWLLVGEGAVDPAQKVVEVFPEFGSQGKDVITIEQLLTHTCGFPYAPMKPEVWLDRDRRIDTMASWKLNWEPGSRYEYHPTSAHWVLAEIIDRVSGRDFREFVNTRVTEPLDVRMQLGLPADEAGDVNPLVSIGELPTTEQLAEFGISGWDPGEVTFDNLEPLTRPEGLEAGVPAAGAAATAADLALFYQALMHNDPPLWDPAVLRQGTAEVRFDTEEQLLGIPANRTLGLTLAGDDGKASLRGFGHTVSGRAFGHGGAGGQIGWADPESGLSFGYVTDGFDNYIPHVWRRIAGLSSKAGLCAS
jgi:CubicO group peptidase (beta-lactamase class C family)